jgi:hypothetical protein
MGLLNDAETDTLIMMFQIRLSIDFECRWEVAFMTYLLTQIQHLVQSTLEIGAKSNKNRWAVIQESNPVPP